MLSPRCPDRSDFQQMIATSQQFPFELLIEIQMFAVVA
jgi:hypothetical protein